MLSVELLLDPRTEDAVRNEWAALERAGLPHAGRNPSPSNRPHVTLAVRDALVPAEFAAVATLLPLPIELGGVLLFGHRARFVLARQVIVSAALLELHRAVAVIAGPPGPRHLTSAPDHWTPHVTLARRLEAGQVAEALRATDLAPLRGAATGLRVWNATTKTITTLR